MKAVHTLNEEDVTSIIYQYYADRGLDADVECSSGKVEYEVTIDNWSMENFEGR